MSEKKVNVRMSDTTKLQGKRADSVDVSASLGSLAGGAQRMLVPVELTDPELGAESGNAPTQSIRLANGGADDKGEIRISVADRTGRYKRLKLVDSLPRQSSVVVDLSSAQMQISSAMLMARGADGIGRYLRPLDAPTGRHFRTIECEWIAQPGDPTIEEHLFLGAAAT